MFRTLTVGLLLSSMLLATSCNVQKPEEQTEKEEGFVSEVLLNSFENYYDCYDFYHSGEFEINFVKEPTLVSDGERAMQLSSDVKNAGEVTTMTVGVPLASVDGTGKNHRDFSKMNRITFDVYNESEQDVIVSTSIMQRKIGYMYTNTQSVTLEAKSKTTVTYEVNRYEIFYALGIAGPSHVNLSFKGEDALVSVDNLRLHYTEDEFVAPTVEIDKDEIVGFEKSYQAFVTYTTGTTYKAEIVADMTSASQGNCFVKIRREGIEDGVALYTGGKFGVSANYLSNINFEAYPTDAYIAFDYKTSWSGNSLWTVPRLVSAESGLYANINGCSLDCDKKWHTYYIPLSFAPRFFDTIEIDFQGGTFGEVYLDNFRVETKLPEGIASKYVARSYAK